MSITAALLCLLQFLTPLSISANEADEYDVFFTQSHGYAMISDVAPFIVDGRAFMAIGILSDAFAVYVAWDDDAKTATLQRGATTARLTIGSGIMHLAEGSLIETIEMDAVPMIKGGHICVPVRSVAEAFGLTVVWYDSRSADRYVWSKASNFNYAYENTEGLVLITEEVAGRSNPCLYLRIGINELLMDGSWFYSYYEGAYFRFAYPRFYAFAMFFEPDAVTYDFTGGSISYDPDGRNITVFTTPAYGTGHKITVAYEPVGGMPFADLNPDLAESYISALHTADISYERATVNDIPALTYSFIPRSGNEERATYGIAFIHGDMLMRFEVAALFLIENDAVVYSDGKALEDAKRLYDALMPTLFFAHNS